MDGVCARGLALRRVLEEMDRQHLSCSQLAKMLRRRSGPGSVWTEQYLAMRLGQLLPCHPDRPGLGGWVPLTDPEIAEFAAALKVPAGQLLGEHTIAAADVQLAHIRRTWRNAFAAQQAELAAVAL
jgi:hypothetical protein